jgi:hypothetical protein
VVPRLLGVVEDLDFLRIADRLPDDVLEDHVGLGLARDELVQLVHVARVVLAVVEADRVRRDDGGRAVSAHGRGGRVIGLAFVSIALLVAMSTSLKKKLRSGVDGRTRHDLPAT